MSVSKKLGKQEALERFSQVTAHDLNNLIAVTSLYVDLLKEKVKKGSYTPQDLEKSLTTISGSLSKVTLFTKQLQSFGRSRSVRCEASDMNLVIQDALKKLEESQPQWVKVQTALAADLKPVPIDGDQVKQMLFILVRNANDFMRASGGRVEIRTTRVQLDALVDGELGPFRGNYCEVSVIDSGSGMNEEVLERMGEPYFTSKPKGAGIGLGLATVYGIMSSLGGNLVISSKLGQGTCFRLYFPENAPSVEQ